MVVPGSMSPTNNKSRRKRRRRASQQPWKTEMMTTTTETRDDGFNWSNALISMHDCIFLKGLMKCDP